MIARLAAGPQREQQLKISISSYWKGFLSGLAIGVFFLLLTRPVHDESPREEIRKILKNLVPAKAQIELNARKSGALAGSGTGVEIAPWPTAPLEGVDVDFQQVTANGVLIVQGGRQHALVVVAPRLEGGAVRWSCFVWPWSVSPANCRNLPPANSFKTDALPARH